MLGFNKHLVAKGCVVLKQFKQAEDRCICLVRYPDGSNAIWRCYDRPVPAYEKLVAIKCDELPEVYRYTATECGGCLVEEEFVDGISLNELVRDHRLDELQTAAIARHVCKALVVLHGLDMVHRDVKPENIIVTSKGRIALIDLDAVSPKSSEKDRDTRLLGTVGYAAPEQYGFGHSDGRADIFGVGVLMNVLLTGKHPARQLADGTLRKVIEKCIAINVDQRYATVEQLMAQLPEVEDKYCPDCGFLSPGGGCIFCGKSGTGSRIQQRRGVRWVAAATLLFLIFAMGIGVFMHADDYVDEPPSDTSPLTDDVSETPDHIPEQPEPQVSNMPSDVFVPDTEQQPEDVSKNEELESDVQGPLDEAEPEPVSTETPVPQSTPETSPFPQVTTWASEESHPIYYGDAPPALTAFSYDLNDDGVVEEYYFGLLLDSSLPPKFCTRDVIRYESGEDGYVIRKMAPAVWKQSQNGDFVLEEAFADLVGDPVISLYERKETDALLSVREAEELYSWRGAVEIRYNYGVEGMWVAVATGVLGENKLTASILASVTTKANQAPIQEIMLTNGMPVEEVQSLTWKTKNELLIGEYTVYDCTVQRLDNGYIRFLVDFIGPKGLDIAIFDPPDGELFHYVDRSGTSGEREKLIFDMPESLVHTADKLTISFGYRNGSRFLVFFDTISGV